MVKRMEDKVKDLERKIKQTTKKAEREIRKLEKFIKQERKKDKPDRKAIEKAEGKIKDIRKQMDRPVERWGEDLDKRRRALRKLPAARSQFREAILELSGLTGRGGRIFETSVALKELKAQKAPQPIGIQDLLAFAEAMNYGAFSRPAGPNIVGALPAFAKGGIHTGGLALVGEKGPEVVQMPPARVYPTGTAPMGPMNFDVRVYIGNREITDVVRTEIREKDRRAATRYRAGNIR
jgi:hypothetical protein